MVTAKRRVLERFWEAKRQIARLPGAYQVYQWITKRHGEGQVYTLRLGRMRGLKWRRHNALPLWYHLGLWEPHVSNLIASHLRPGEVFWDVGANAGYHTIMAARLVGRTGSVVAFEPNPDVVDVLYDQIALNGFHNCAVERVAVGREAGRIAFTRTANPLMAGIAEHVHDHGGENVEVQCVPLDQMLERHAAPNLIKADVEGAELDMLLGAQNLLATARPRILLSVHGGEAAAACRAELERHGYTLTPQPGFEQMLVALPQGATQSVSP